MKTVGTTEEIWWKLWRKTFDQVRLACFLIWTNFHAGSLEHRKHFRKYTDKERHHEGEPYDLQSVLHLPMNAFAIEPERQSMRIRNGPGQRTLTSDEGLSNSDVRKIRQRYCQGWSDAAISAEVEMQLNDQPATVENSTSTNNVTDKKKKKDEEDKKNASDERKEKEKERRREEQRRKSEVEKKKKKGRGKRIADNQQESKQRLVGA